MSNEQVERWLPIADAVSEAGVGQRTVYRWVKEKKLPTKAEGGVKLIEVGALRAFAARRATDRPPAPPSAIAVNAAVSGKGNDNGGSTRPGDQPGDLAGRVFAHFDVGITPAEVVTREKVPPQAVIDLHRQYVAMKELGPAGRTSFADRVDAIESQALRTAQLLDQHAVATGESLGAHSNETAALGQGMTAAINQLIAQVQSDSARIHALEQTIQFLVQRR